MAKAILILGRICCGKSTYAEQMRREYNAVLLSVDEIMLTLFDQQVGEKHDEYVRNTKKYLLNKSVELIKAGMSVMLDWGFWTKDERDFTKEFYRARNITCEAHYIEISDEVWKQRLNKRNHQVLEGEARAYLVDENLAEKFNSIFEMPGEEEIDVWVSSANDDEYLK